MMTPNAACVQTGHAVPLPCGSPDDRDRRDGVEGMLAIGNAPATLKTTEEADDGKQGPCSGIAAASTLRVITSTSEQFATMVAEEGARYADVIRAAQVPLN